MICKQKYLGYKGLITLITFLTTITPMSIDMYLPALPRMTSFFGTTESLTNLTILCYFIFFAISMLFWGPISDKYGRKVILLVCIALHTAGSVQAIFSSNIWMLIVARTVQALGGGGISAVSTAIIKDSFEGRRRETTLAIIQSMMFLGPILAPILGGVILEYASWQWVFVALGVAGLIAAGVTAFVEETLSLENRHQGKTFESLKKLGAVLANKRFSTLLFIFSIIGVPFFAYLASVSYIYQNHFGLNEQVSSYYFAATGLLSVAGPLLYLKISESVSSNLIITVSFGALIFCGIVIYLFGHVSPMVFLLVYTPNSILVSLLRPPATSLMLEQETRYVGAASSLIGFCAIAAGCLGMGLTSFLKLDYIDILGVEVFAVGVVASFFWRKSAKAYS